MKTEVKPTIAWLWDCFQKLGAYIETEKFLQSWGTKGSDGLSHDGRNHSADEVELQSLRQQLVERLDLITVGTPKKTRAYMLFGFTGSNDEAISFIPRNDHDEEFKPTIEQCKELSAIFAFCGWELGQRAKEAKGE